MLIPHSSVRDGICALGKAHNYAPFPVSTLPLKQFKDSAQTQMMTARLWRTGSKQVIIVLLKTGQCQLLYVRSTGATSPSEGLLN